MSKSVAEQMLEPLEVGETYLHLEADLDEIATLPSAQLRLYAMAELLRFSAENGYDVTRGPWVRELHRPDYPGDATWAKVVAIGRQIG